jgi:hypothetical protein
MNRAQAAGREQHLIPLLVRVVRLDGAGLAVVMSGALQISHLYLRVLREHVWLHSQDSPLRLVNTHTSPAALAGNSCSMCGARGVPKP